MSTITEDMNKEFKLRDKKINEFEQWYDKFGSLCKISYIQSMELYILGVDPTQYG